MVRHDVDLSEIAQAIVELATDVLGIDARPHDDRGRLPAGTALPREDADAREDDGDAREVVEFPRLPMPVGLRTGWVVPPEPPNDAGISPRY